MNVTPIPSRTAVMEQLHGGLVGIREQIADANAAPERAVSEAKAATDQRFRVWLPLVLVAAVASSVLTAAGMYFVFGPQINDLRVQQTADASARDEVRRVAQEARDQATAANAELERRGQPQVPVPAVGQATDADVLVSAATAQVLAALPDAQPVTAAAIAAAVADFMARNPVTPVGPSSGQIADSVADYLQANPPPAGAPGADGADGADGQSITGPQGEQGPQGEPGPPPTAAEIRAALELYFVDNPIPPCPAGTELQQVTFGLAGPSGLACVFVDGG